MLGTLDRCRVTQGPDDTGLIIFTWIVHKSSCTVLTNTKYMNICLDYLFDWLS